MSTFRFNRSLTALLSYFENSLEMFISSLTALLCFVDSLSHPIYMAATATTATTPSSLRRVMGLGS